MRIAESHEDLMKQALSEDIDIVYNENRYTAFLLQLTIDSGLPNCRN